MHVLENNKKPATHFIEVYKHGYSTKITMCRKIEKIGAYLRSTLSMKGKTVAIFKIRFK